MVRTHVRGGEVRPFPCTSEESHQLGTEILQPCAPCPLASSGPRGSGQWCRGGVSATLWPRMARDGRQVPGVAKAATSFRLRISLRAALTVRRSDKSLMDSRLWNRMAGRSFPPVVPSTSRAACVAAALIRSSRSKTFRDSRPGTASTRCWVSLAHCSRLS